MLAEFMAETGRAVLKGVPPDGRDYWAAGPPSVPPGPPLP